VRESGAARVLHRGLADGAERLWSLPEVSTAEDLGPALKELRFARQRIRSGRAAGRSGWLAPGLIARATARESAWATAASAAWAAARAGVGDIAGDRVRAAARAAAGDAGAAMVRVARLGAGRSVARAAAGVALAAPLEELQEAAFALLDRMLPPADVPVAGFGRVEQLAALPV
jgi:hypothetical protein